MTRLIDTFRHNPILSHMPSALGLLLLSFSFLLLVFCL
jgi:hypothetical protein